MEQMEQVEILLVEDNPLDAELTIRALKKGGLANKLLWLKDGAQALDYLFRRGNYADRDDVFPRLVLLDLKMPRVDGMAFYRAIAATTPALAARLIFVTGDVVGTDAERFLEDSGCRWLAKPFRLGDLLRAARDVLA